MMIVDASRNLFCYTSNQPKHSNKNHFKKLFDDFTLTRKRSTVHFTVDRVSC